MDKDKLENVINYLLLIDDLKRFSKCGSQIESLVQTVDIYSKDVGMKLGKRVACTEIKLPTGEAIADLEEFQYKYHAILELGDIIERQMKELITEIYTKRL